MPPRPFWLISLLIGCAPGEAVWRPSSPVDEEGDEAGIVSSDTGVACRASITRLDPPGEARHVPLNAPVTLHLDGPLPEGAPWSLTVDGQTGVVTWSPDRTQATFVPDHGWEPETSYTVQASVCDELSASTFNTIGHPVPLPELIGRSWSVAAEDAAWISPSCSWLLTELIDLESAQVAMVPGPPGSPPHLVADIPFAGPDVCLPDIDLGAIDMSLNPKFSVGPGRVEVPWEGDLFTADQVMLFGYFDEGGATIADLGLTARVDTRPIDRMVEGLNICQAAAALGEPCTACADGELACLSIVLTVGSAERTAEPGPPEDGAQPDCDKGRR